MAFISFTDQWQVLIDDQGNPLIGRLKFLDYSTSQPKLVYQDINLTIEAENPQYTDITGKLENQIILGYGDYKVVFQRYIGSGNMKDSVNADDDSLWISFKTEDVSGLASSTATSGINVLVVDTIQELRTVDVSSYTTVTVLGYYSRFDNIAARTYVWSSNDTRADNFGTIIQKTGQNTGRWNMLEPEEMDTRYFGVFPSTTLTYNSNLTALLSWINSSYCKTKTILFSTGTYSFVSGTFQFNKKIVIEDEVKFDLIGSGVLTLNIASDFEIKTNIPLITSYAKTNSVIINFMCDNDKIQNKKVLSTWFGEWNNHADSNTLIAIGERVNSGYDIYFTGDYYHTSGTCNIDNLNVFFEGSIHLNGGILNFTNSNISNLDKETTAITYVTSAGQMQKLKFNDCIVRSSLFNSNNFQYSLQSQTSSTSSRFIFDSDVSFSSSYTDNGIFIFEHELGLITASVPGSFAIFNSFKLPQKQVFASNSWVGLKNQDSRLCYFMPNEPTQTDEENAFYSSIRAAAYGNGILDLCQMNPEINALTSDKQIYSSDSTELLKIHNGSITISSVVSVFTFISSFSRFELSNVSVFDTTTAGATLVNSTSGGNIGNLVLDNVIYQNINEEGTIISTSNGGNIDSADVKNCDFQCGWLANETTLGAQGLLQINVHNNRRLKCGFKARNAKPVIESNYIQGCSATHIWEVKCMYSALINANRFFECDVHLLDNFGFIDHVVTSNQLESSDSYYSRIIAVGQTSDTKIQGMVIQSNSFTGVLSNSAVAPVMIYCEGSFSSDVEYTDFGSTRTIYQSVHKCIVKDNIANDRKMIVPSTEGIVYANSIVNATRTRVDIDGYLRYIYSQSLLPDMFYIPGSTYAIIGDINIMTNSNIGGTSDSTNQYWYEPLGYDAAYRSDGKFVYAIYMTSDEDQYPTFLTFDFKMYGKAIRQVAI